MTGLKTGDNSTSQLLLQMYKSDHIYSKVFSSPIPAGYLKIRTLVVATLYIVKIYVGTGCISVSNKIKTCMLLTFVGYLHMLVSFHLPNNPVSQL